MSDKPVKPAKRTVTVHIDRDTGLHCAFEVTGVRSKNKAYRRIRKRLTKRSDARACTYEVNDDKVYLTVDLGKGVLMTVVVAVGDADLDKFKSAHYQQSVEGAVTTMTKIDEG